jgi:hypothetical protein
LYICRLSMIFIFYNLTDCRPGYHGETCSTPCKHPYYGIRCSNTCNCTESECHLVYGCSNPKSSTIQDTQAVPIFHHDDAGCTHFFRILYQTLLQGFSMIINICIMTCITCAGFHKNLIGSISCNFSSFI